MDFKKQVLFSGKTGALGSPPWTQQGVTPATEFFK